MEFTEIVKEHPVIDYDFAFVGGGRLPVTVAESKGDYLVDNGNTFVVTLAEKPNILDPDKNIPGEVITVFKQHLTAFIERRRMQREMTKEEMLSMRNLLHPEPKEVQ